MDVKKYLEEHKIETADKLVSHIEELKRNTFPDFKLVSELVHHLEVGYNDFGIYKDDVITISNRGEKEMFKLQENKDLQEKFTKCVNYIYREKPKRPKNLIVSITENSPLPEADYTNFISGGVKRGKIFSSQPTEQKVSKTEGIKETEGKLYYELSWEFIEEMAKRMANNKSNKYPLFNWKKNINVEDLKQAINRHHIEVMKGNYKDGDELLGHVVSYACNSMMLWEQLNKS